MFDRIFENSTVGISYMEVLICLLSALILGIIIALLYKKLCYASKSFMLTLALLPMIVLCVIMMVNGNLGTGVAVLGAFSLVRFRSVPGTSREILFIFFSMAIGLALGMGQVLFAFVITIVIAISAYGLNQMKYFEDDKYRKELKIMIPEDLDYEEVFDDLFEQYCKQHQLLRVRTIQLGTLIELVYEIHLKKNISEKAFMDDLRVRNANLTIILSKRGGKSDEL